MQPCFPRLVVWYEHGDAQPLAFAFSGWELASILLSLALATFCSGDMAELKHWALIQIAMSDQSDSDNAKGWHLLWEFVHKKPFVDIFVTCGRFYLHPLRFTDEVIREDWRGKAKPPWFLIETYILALLLRLLTPLRMLSQEDPTFTSLQKSFTAGANLVSFACAFFVASFAMHLFFGRDRLQFIHALFLFCYVQGVALISAHVLEAFLSLAFGESTRPMTLMLTGGFELLCSAAIMVFVAIPVIRAYRPRWYRLVFGGLAAFLIFVIAKVGFSYISDGIVARFPKS